MLRNMKISIGRTTLRGDTAQNIAWNYAGFIYQIWD